MDLPRPSQPGPPAREAGLTGPSLDVRYPAGRFTPVESLEEAEREHAMSELARAPGRLREAVEGLEEAQLDTPYREGGWTLRQVVHHLPDSHVNGYVRMKWALTEDEPTLKPYEQAGWAELPDGRGPIEPSLLLLDALHVRWVSLIRGLEGAAFRRRLVHPEGGRPTIDGLLALYAWHGRHHTAQITALRERRGW